MAPITGYMGNLDHASDHKSDFPTQLQIVCALSTSIGPYQMVERTNWLDAVEFLDCRSPKDAKSMSAMQLNKQL